jgi:hypothetical protein
VLTGSRLVGFFRVVGRFYLGWFAGFDTRDGTLAGRPLGRRLLEFGIMATQRRPPIHDDNLETILDRVAIMREEVTGIERSLERVIAKQEKGRAKPKEN